MKCCTSCSQIKEYKDFYKDNRKLDKHRSECKSCTAQKDRNTRFKTQEQRDAFKLKKKGHDLKLKYNLTLESYTKMYKHQQGLCAICSKPILEHGSVQDKYNMSCVDHNHVTGKVRGLLCHSCNRALGLFQDSPELLEKAKLYLENTNV